MKRVSDPEATVTAKAFQRQPGRYQRLAQAQPLTITAHGEPSLIVMSIAEYRRLATGGAPRAAEKAPNASPPHDRQLRHVLSVLRRLRKKLETRGLAHAGIFGSVARDEAKISSDIDIVVTPAEGRTLDLMDLGAVQEILNEAFEGVEIDLVVEPIRKASLKQVISKERINAF